MQQRRANRVGEVRMLSVRSPLSLLEIQTACPSSCTSRVSEALSLTASGLASGIVNFGFNLPSSSTHRKPHRERAGPLTEQLQGDADDFGRFGAGQRPNAQLVKQQQIGCCSVSRTVAWETVDRSSAAWGRCGPASRSFPD